LPTRHRIVSSLFEVRKEDEFIRHYTFSTHDLAVIRQHRGAHNRLGELRDCSFENQRYRASGLNLVVAAIILWNTVYLERAISTLRSLGKGIPEILLLHLSPLGWEHINMTGDYVWHANRRVVKGGFRSLRSPKEGTARLFVQVQA
jgi:hypothetical protein